MAEKAWPFLIGRAKHAGYRVVVVPDFMADAALVDALSGAARDARLPADTACVRELRGLACGPVTVVYRSFHPRAQDYGLGDDVELSDGFGRPIRVTEGVVLRSAVAAGLPEITVGDLERAHAAVADAYRDFWEGEQGFSRQTSVGEVVGDRGGSSARAVRLEIAEPWGSARAESTLREPVVPEERECRPRRPRAAVVVGCFVLVAGLVVGAQALASALRGKPAPAAGSVLRDFCHALKAGHVDEAYGYASPRLHRALSLPDFDKELLSAATRATTCSYAEQATSGSTARATITVGTGTTPPAVWNVTLVGGGGSSWLINELVPVP